MRQFQQREVDKIKRREAQKRSQAPIATFEGRQGMFSATEYHTPYRMCDRQVAGLQMVDYAILSSLAYFDEKSLDFLNESIPILFANGSKPVISRIPGSSTRVTFLLINS